MIEILRLRKRRYEFFREPERYLKKIKEIAERYLKNPEVYVFGSFAENEHVLSSDIDVLIVSERVSPNDRVRIISDVYREFGYEHPFEIHICDSEGFEWYRRFAKRLIKIQEVGRKLSE